MPPTPTPLPPVDASIELTTQYTLWGATDTAIQYWHLTGDAGQISQVIFLIIFVVLGVKLLVSYLRQMVQRDSDE